MPTKKKTAKRSRTSKKSGNGSKNGSRSRRNPTIKTTGMTDEIQERIRYVRDLKGSSKRVDQLSSILPEVLDRFHMKALSIAVIEELGKTNDPRAIETISFAWNNCQNAEIRSCMVQTLSTFPHRDVLKPLERIALSGGVSEELRIEAVEALGRHRTNDSWTALGRILRAAYEDGDKPLQSAAVEALRRADGKAVAALVKALESEDEEEQASAAAALGIMGDREALEALRTLSNETENAAVQEAATRSAILLYCS